MPESDGEIFIIFDSNVLRGNIKDLESFDEFELGVCDEAQRFIEDNNLSEKIHLMLPEIVLLELTRSKNRKLSEWIATIRDYSFHFSGFKDFIHKLNDIDCRSHIDKIKEKKTVDYEIIGIPVNHTELFKKILDRSINKTPPFMDDESDRGFKDAILFLSLLEFVSNNYTNSNSSFVLFSNDGAFCDKEKCKNKTELQKEFALTGNNLEIRNNKDVIGFIKDRFKFDLDLADYIRTDIFSKTEEELSNYHFIIIDGKKYGIIQCFLSDKTYQEQEGERIKINLAFEVLHSTIPDSYIVESDKPSIDILSKQITLDISSRKILDETDFDYELLKNDE